MISDINKMFYPDNEGVYWKKKAWSDENFCREWEMDYLKIVSENYNLNIETGKRDHLFLFS